MGVTGTEVVAKCDVWTLDPEVDVGACVLGPEVLACWVVVGIGAGIVGEGAVPWVELLGCV